MIVSLCMRTKPILLLGLVLALAPSLSPLNAQCLRRAIQPKAKQEQAPTDSIKAKTFLPASKDFLPQESTLPKAWLTLHLSTDLSPERCS